MPIMTGEAYWASVTQPNTTYEPQYQIDVAIDDAQAEEFLAQGIKVKNKDGKMFVTAKRKVKRPNGDLNKVPLLMNKQKQPITDQIGNGSLVKVQYDIWSSKRNDHKGLDLKAVMVLDLKTYGAADGDELEAMLDEDDGVFGD